MWVDQKIVVWQAWEYLGRNRQRLLHGKQIELQEKLLPDDTSIPAINERFEPYWIINLCPSNSHIKLVWAPNTRLANPAALWNWAVVVIRGDGRLVDIHLFACNKHNMKQHHCENPLYSKIFCRKDLWAWGIYMATLWPLLSWKETLKLDMNTAIMIIVPGQPSLPQQLICLLSSVLPDSHQ